MKKVIVVLSLLGLLPGAFAQAQLEVVVKNVKDTSGNVRVGIFRDEKTFLKEAFVGKVVKAEKGIVKVVFDNLPAGTYAVSIIHDENENGELDSNLIGIPKEGFGFSNDAMGTFGPPNFEKASIRVEGGSKTLAIGMRYL